MVCLWFFGGIGNSFRYAFRTYRRKDTLYLKCEICGKRLTILDNDLLTETARQMAKHGAPAGENYLPSGEAVRLTNAVNRALEHPNKPEDIVSLLKLYTEEYICRFL